MVDGTVKCWGDAAFSGGLGDGTAEGSLAPVTVIAAPGSTSPLSGVIAIAAGDFRSCALLADGTVKCWGSNYIGDLSEAGAKDAAPVTVFGAPGSGSPLSDVIAIDVDGGFTQGAGGYVACALLADGTVKCWLNNDFGGLGDGTTTSSLTPVDVVGIPKDATSITAGCALLVDSTVTCWGSSFFGDGIARDPFTVRAGAGSTNALSGATAIAAGDGQTCAVLVDGSITCWRDSEAPVVVAGLLVALPAATPAPTATPEPTATAEPAATPQPVALSVASGPPSAPTSFRESVPTPAEITLDPITVAQTLVIATGIVVFVPFPGMLFNSTLEAHYAEIVGRVRAARRRLAALFARLSSWARRRLGRPAAPSATEVSTIEPARTTRAEFWRTPRGIALFVLVTALLGSFLDPTFGLDARSLAVFGGLAAGLIAILLASNIPRAIAYRWSGVEFFVRALPGTLVVGGACVLISRLSEFQPGYLYGLIVGLGAARSLSGVGEGRTAAVATVVVLVVAGTAWFGLWWLSDLTLARGEPPLASVALQTAFATIVVAGLEGAAIGLLPMRFLPGETVFRWNRWVWGTLLGLAMLGFLLILVNPTSGYLADSSRTPMVTIVALLLLFGLGSVLFWAYFRFRRVPATPSAAS